MEPLGTRPGIAPDAKVILPDRRRRPRYKTHTPAYARLQNDSGKVMLDLSEILDINEDGIAIQAAPPLEPNRKVNLCLDLSETNASIQTTGLVVWSDRSGRAGIRLPTLPDASRKQLREWLFLNALATCADPRATTKAAQDAGVQAGDSVHDSAASSFPTVSVLPQEAAAPTATDYTALLAALAAVQKEVESLGGNLDAALQLLAERALAFTHASGAAIALHSEDRVSPPHLAENEYMICRARAGSDAPPIGTQLHIGSGFSGECVRTGRLLRCDDAETDPHVDRESCRLLGIRSILAAPIRQRDEVVGLMEVFSPLPCAFNESDEKILQRLAETTLASLRRTNGTQPSGAAPEAAEVVTPPSFEDSQPTALPQERLRGIPVHRAHLAFLLTFAALIALVLGFLVAPWVDNKWRQGSAHAETGQHPSSTTGAIKTVSETVSLEDLRKLAEQGDPAAQFAMGAHYATGEDVNQDYVEASRWFGKAAEQGNVPAQSALGAYYWVGRGVPRDLEKAYFWSILARAGGDETSKYRVAVLTSRMTRPQITTLQQQADNWLRQHQLPASPSPAQ